MEVDLYFAGFFRLQVVVPGFHCRLMGNPRGLAVLQLARIPIERRRQRSYRR
jgi:hypothetical protein